jgi:electron transport complex protein RnfC
MKYHKEQTAHLSITRLADPAFVYIPLNQHIGAPAIARVQKGDAVQVGQVIGTADAFVTATVHASVSGVVDDIVSLRTAQGQTVQAVKIKNDFLNTIHASVTPKKNLEELTAAEIRMIVREAGLVGMGGAAFPTHVKITPPDEKKVDTVILNAAECEPFLTADHRLLLEKTDDVIYGLRAVAKAVQAKKIYIGIESNKLDALELLIKAAKPFGIKIKVLPTRYPMGAEKVLVKKVLGRKVANKGIPLDVGVVVCNVGTAYQISQSIKTGLPLIERVVTVSGRFSNPGNYLVKVGTLYKDMVTLPFDAETGMYKIVSGGPMMGFSVDLLDIPVTKGTSGVLLLAMPEKIEEPCIRCGKCVDICPLGLRPYQQQGMDECMECGCCAYECPTNRFLVQKARIYKQELRAAAKK